MGYYVNTDDNKCPICGKEDIKIFCDAIQPPYYFYRCPRCGEYVAPIIDYDRSLKDPSAYPDFGYHRDHLRKYLFYHPSERVPFLAPQKAYEELEERGGLYDLTPEMVENWYPKTFADKIDLILVWLAEKSAFMGEAIAITIEELSGLFFMKNDIPEGDVGEEKYVQELNYIGGFLQQEGFIQAIDHMKGRPLGDSVLYNNGLWLILLNKGYNRIYELQKRQENNKDVFVAMKFGEQTRALRAAIKSGIERAGYKAVILDEVQYNGQIVPEMLYRIRQSKFVVAELSHHNNGAYYEAGYAAGYGKEVIQICSEEALKSELHFDVAQVNSITYHEDDLEELADRLQKRIEATMQ